MLLLLFDFDNHLWPKVKRAINIEIISTSEIRITCMIAEDQVETAVRALHKAFALEEPEPILEGDAGPAKAGA